MKRHAGLVLAGGAAVVLAAGLAAGLALGAEPGDPGTEPVPVPAYADPERSFAAMLDFTGPLVAKPVEVVVVRGAPPGTKHLPQDMTLRGLARDATVSEQGIPHPAMASLEGPEYPYMPGQRMVIAPFDTRTDTIALTDNATGARVATVDTAPAITAECKATPAAPECAYNLTVGLSASPDPVPAGTPLSYQVSVRNAGTGPALETVAALEFPYPPSAVPSGCTADGKKVTCTVGRVSAGESKDLAVVVPIPPGAAAGSTGKGSVRASASVSSGAWPEAVTTDNAATLDTTVIAVSDLVVTKTGVPDVATAGDTVTYTVEVRNQGPSDADLLTVTDLLPPPGEADFVSATLPGGTCEVTPAPVRSVICKGGTPLPAGVTLRPTIVIKVSDTGSAVTLTDTAGATSAGTDPNPASNQGSTSTRVILVVTKLAAEPVILHVNHDASAILMGELSARLSRADREGSVTGRTLVFEIGGREVCRAVTDSTGKAVCRDLRLSLDALRHKGYKVRFGGDGRYAATSADGDLLIIVK
ncbi:DUF11 domain-containing protein [Longispora albida]|uniref:DUF11 domain-containing protein n=1 Tax=Longispora albida TaxID=203523 RepID=UPI00036206A6|nr:DUF11 domain-containing protein [Longispora albida]